MKLFYSPNSPYARIARIGLRESGLISDVIEVVAANRQPNNPVLEFSPVGRVPVLVANDLVITETKNVYEYIFEFAANDSANDSMSEPATRKWNEIVQEGQILGFLEGIASWVRENRRNAEQRSNFLVSVEADRACRCLAALNSGAENKGLPDIPIFRAVALSVSLALMDLHQLVPNWRDDHRKLFEWFDRQARRPSVRETAPTL